MGCHRPGKKCINNKNNNKKSLSPPLLHGDLIDDTTKLSDVFKLLRSYCQFAPSESTFMKFATLILEVINGTLERPLHLYLRMWQFIRDNLLLSSGRIAHDRAIPSKYRRNIFTYDGKVDSSTVA